MKSRIGLQCNDDTMMNEKYYNGFEGDEEICFRLFINEKEVESIGVWGGYLSSIVKLIPAQKEGWIGLAYYYHLNIGWYDEENWVVPDIALFYEQLREIDENLLSFNEDKEVLYLLQSMFRRAKDLCGKITISSY